MSDKILFVDDDANLLASFARNLRRQFKLDTAEGGEAGLAKLAESNYAVVVSDRQMPGMDGLQFLTRVKQCSPQTIRMMLTGNVDLDQAVQVVNEGNIFRILIKPCPIEIVTKALEDALTQYRLVNAEKELLGKTLGGAIKLLTELLAASDAKAFGRSERLRTMVTEVGAKATLANVWEIHLAAMLGPVGLVTLPLETLAKAREHQMLSKAEEQLLHSVPEIAAKLLTNIPRLENVANIVRHQQRRFDGGGAPTGSLRSEALPIGSRLLKILNDMLELQEEENMRPAEAIADLQRRQGWYDPALLSAVAACFASGEKRDHEYQTLSMTVKSLDVGMVLTTDVCTRDGTLILAAGNRVTGMALQKIRNFDLVLGVKEPIFVKSKDTHATHLLEMLDVA